MDIPDISHFYDDISKYLASFFCHKIRRSELLHFQGHLLKLDPGWRNWRPRMPLSQGHLEVFQVFRLQKWGRPPKMVKHRRNYGGKLWVETGVPISSTSWNSWKAHFLQDGLTNVI